MGTVVLKGTRFNAEDGRHNAYPKTLKNYKKNKTLEAVSKVVRMPA